jgi:L-amino acid N-acyltransferase YncA
MSRMTGLIEEAAGARLGWTSPRLHSWYAEERLLRQIKNGLVIEIGRVGNAEFGSEYRDQVGLGVGTDPLDWANRRVALSAGGWAVSGIRFRGRDLALPFIDVITTSEPPTPDGLAVVAEGLLPAYEAFAPLCLRVDAPDPAGLLQAVEVDPRYGQRCAVDLYVVAGLVEDLRARPRADSYEVVTVRPGPAAVLAQRVAEIYAQNGELNPQQQMWAQPEDEDSLAECAEQGLLFEVLVDGEPAGVVASIRYDAHAMTGFSVQELCLDAHHRGKRLAAGVLQRLIDALPVQTGDVLWGTIHPDNTASLRNSMTVGREIVGAYVWITPASLPGMPQQATH